MNGRFFLRFGTLSICLAALALCDIAWAAPAAKKYTSIFRDATVFCDMDNNSLQGVQEKSVLTDRQNGVYTPPPCKNGRLVLRGGIDIVTGKPNDRLQVLPNAARAPQGNNSGQTNRNGQTWEKNPESKAFNLVTRVWKALQDNGQDNASANQILNQFVDCYAGRCYDTTPDPNRKPADLPSGQREMWLAHGQLGVLNEAIEKLTYRLQGQRFYGEEQNSVSALAQALIFVYGDRGRPPELANLRDVSDLLDHALTLMQVRGPDGVYKTALPDIADLAVQLNDAFDAALSTRQPNFRPYQNLQIAAGKAAQDLGDNLDLAVLRSCYTGDGLRQRLGDPAKYCEGERPQSRCVLPDPATETRAKACPSGQTGTIQETCTWSCPNPTGNPVKNCADAAACVATVDNRAPIAAAQSLTATAGVALPLTLSAVDPDGDKLSYGVVVFPGHGSLSGTPPNLTYTAAAGYSGQDSFTFKANDGKADSLVATVTITVGKGNSPPVAAAQSVAATAGVALPVTLSASDPDGDRLSYSVVAFPGHGGLSGAAPNLTYTAAADYSGADSFAFKANDGKADSLVATVTITVKAACVLPNPATETRTQSCPSGQTGTIAQTRTASCPSASGSPVWSDWTTTANTCQAQSVNHAPVAAAQSLTATAGVALAITLSASDQDGDKPSYGVVVFPGHGSLSGTPPNLTYTAAAGYSGQDSFTFKANDGKADSAVATVTITVKAACVLPNPATETRTQSCPSGQTGTITQTRTASCPSASGISVWSDWIEIENTCRTVDTVIYADDFSLTDARIVGADINGKPVQTSANGQVNWTSVKLYQGGIYSFANRSGNGYLALTVQHSSTLATLPYRLGSGVYRISADLYPPGGGYVAIGFYMKNNDFLWQAGVTVLSFNVGIGKGNSGGWFMLGSNGLKSGHSVPGMSGTVDASRWGSNAPAKVTLLWDTLHNTASATINEVSLFKDFDLNSVNISASDVRYVGIGRDGPMLSDSAIDNFDFRLLSR